MINSKAKGSRGEREFLETMLSTLGRDRTAQDRRNWQFTTWAGLDNPDVSIKGLERMHFEVKYTKNYAFPAFRKQVEQDCPAHKVPVIAYRIDREPGNFWLHFPVKHLEKFSLEVVTAFGYEVSKPCGQ